MSEDWVIVDGYSVMHAWPGLQRQQGRSLQQRRESLIRLLRQYADHSGRKVTVVFDGYAAKRKPEVSDAVPGLDLVFSEPGKTADDVIERLVARSEHRAKIVVVTSDSLERQTVESMGAHSLSAEAFERAVEAALRDLAGSVQRHSGAPRGKRAGQGKGV
jgi:predicted RNA-binding protein with PIN domain